MATSVCTAIPNRKEKIQALMTQMNGGLLERDHQVRLMMLAALAGEHVLLIGPPGTAKSELAKRLKDVFVEANYFERLVTRFSVPEELFGPLSIKALEEDRYNRLTSGYLPEASVAFIDEIFKANSAILNSLLTLLNERQFDNGNRRVKVPLISVVAASNELPNGEELSALYDRFILRSYVSPVSNDSFDSLLDSIVEPCDPDISVRLKIEDLEEVQRLADKVVLTPAIKDVCKEFRNYLAAQDIYVSDRRWRKLVKLMKVSAFTSGFNETSIYDAWILPHCLWEQPEQFEGLQELFHRLITVDGLNPPHRIIQVIKAWEIRLKDESCAQKYNASGKPVYYDIDGNETTEKQTERQAENNEGKLIYRNAQGRKTTNSNLDHWNRNQPWMETVENKPVIFERGYSQAHINSRLQEVKAITNSIKLFVENVNEELENVSSYYENHLWLDMNLLPEIIAALKKSRKEAEKLLKRATSLEIGFGKLPLESDLTIEVVDSDKSNHVIEGELCD